MSEVVSITGEPLEDLRDKPTLHDVSAILRNIAAEIDNGIHPGADTAVVVLMGKELNVFGAGADATGLRCIGLMHLGIQKIADAIIK